RILEDSLREDRHLVPGLTGSQITAIIVGLVCLWHLIFVRHTPRWGRWDERTERRAPDEPAPTGRRAPDEPALDEPTADEPPPAETPPLPSSVAGEAPENEE